MSISHKIKQTRAPQEALLLLAEAIDQVNRRLDRLEHQPADAWQDWTAFVPASDLNIGHEGLPSSLQWGAPPPGEAAARAQVERQKAIDAVKEQLKTAVGEEADALNAKLRLLQDSEANVMQPSVPEGARVAIDSDGTNGTVETPPPTQERIDARGAWAIEHKLWEFIPLDEYDSTDAFTKGGASWLYYGNREAVMQMPYEWRVWLVEDIAVDSPAEAQEVGRDILKQMESADRAITVQAIDGLSASRGLR